MSRGWVFPWLMIDGKRLSVPVPYQHPSGAVTWVDLEFDVTQRIARSKAQPALAAHFSLNADASASSRGSSAIAHSEGLNEPSQSDVGPTASSALISPDLEARLVAVADKLGVHVDPLGSANTKMRRFVLPYSPSNHLLLVNRMPRSTPRFQVFIAPAVDQQLESVISKIPGIQRFSNSRTGDHRMQHSAFRVFREQRTRGEPFGHGWLLEEHRAAEQFSTLVEIVRAG